jgi:hypothetical protein
MCETGIGLLGFPMHDEAEPWATSIGQPDMQEALLRFKEDAGKILDSSLGHLASQEPPPIIYHYTDDKGLRGILESGCLWLTDVFNLNDPSEMAHSFSQAVKVLNTRAASGPPESQTFARLFEAFAREGAIQKIAHFFVCSFSAHGDDLGQWRAYADNGRGYALAFDAKTLEQEFVSQSVMPPFSNGTFPVIYSDAQLVGIYSQIINAMFHLISLPRGKQLQKDVVNAYMGQLQFWLTYYALQAMLYFKHEAYSNEKEYRFLQIFRADAEPEMKLRQRPYSLIRYREFDWKSKIPSALTGIVVGPAADRRMAAEFARSCLRSFHEEGVVITHSEIPYRAT